MTRVLVCLVFSLIWLLILPLKTFASESYNFGEVSDGQVNEALMKTVPVRFLPSSPLHLLISTKETFARIFKPSAVRRAEFDFVLSGKRLKEAYLLSKAGDFKGASKTLDAYSERSKKMTKQIAKARSQNQDLAKLTGTIADDLRAHEILLSAIYKSESLADDAYSFQSNFQKAYEGFVGMIEAVDEIMPGVRDRFWGTRD